MSDPTTRLDEPTSRADNRGCRECQRCPVLSAPASTTVVAAARRIFSNFPHTWS